ncbi:hypothetical protein YIM_07040 [Amycolatopsis sp. YIM 10]|nr:hypothetical protein YIM_07040 [Amycolatopsis sp. YIM 10]
MHGAGLNRPAGVEASAKQSSLSGPTSTKSATSSGAPSPTANNSWTTSCPASTTSHPATRIPQRRSRTSATTTTCSATAPTGPASTLPRPADHREKPVDARPGARVSSHLRARPQLLARQAGRRHRACPAHERAEPSRYARPDRSTTVQARPTTPPASPRRATPARHQRPPGAARCAPAPHQPTAPAPTATPAQSTRRSFPHHYVRSPPQSARTHPPTPHPRIRAADTKTPVRPAPGRRADASPRPRQGRTGESRSPVPATTAGPRPTSGQSEPRPVPHQSRTPWAGPDRQPSDRAPDRRIRVAHQQLRADRVPVTTARARARCGNSGTVEGDDPADESDPRANAVIAATVGASKQH